MEAAAGDIMIFEDILLAARRTNPEIPSFRLYSDDIIFGASDAVPPKNYTHLAPYKISPSDKNIYQLTLHFYIAPDEKNRIYGDIYYGENGEIEKFNSVFEHDKSIIYITASNKNGTLAITKIVHDKAEKKSHSRPFIAINRRAGNIIAASLIIVATAILTVVIYIHRANIKANEGAVYLPPEVTNSAREEDEETSEINIGETSGAVETVFHEETAVKESVSEEMNTETLNAYDTTQSTETQTEAAVTETDSSSYKLELVSITSPAARNSEATVKIKGLPNTDYSIAVMYSSGKSGASGLEDKTSDSDGYITWSWKIGGRTNTGSYKIIVTGKSDRLEFEIEIVE